MRRRARGDKVWLAIGTLRWLQTKESLRQRVKCREWQANCARY